MSFFEKWLLLTSALATAVTGLVFAWMRYLMAPTDPWAVIHHPLEPWVLKAHILAAPVLVFAVGLIAVSHAWSHFRARVRPGRRSGLLLMASFVPMVVSGYLIQAVTAERLLGLLVVVHDLTGVLFALALALHAREFARRKEPKLAAGRRSAEPAPEGTVGHSHVAARRVRRRVRMSLLALVAWVVYPLSAQGPAARDPLPARAQLDVLWTPEEPLQGTLFRVEARLEDGPVAIAAARFAGEPLHFEADSAGGWWAVAAVPVDARGPLALELTLSFEDGTSRSVRREVSVSPGSDPMEQLSVAPAYADPKPALAARSREEAARAMAVARGAHATPRMWRPERVVRPRTSRITSPFGSGREFNGRIESRHMGTDFDGEVGEPVVVAADGVVALVDDFYLGGGVVYVDHGGGVSTGYLHLSAKEVTVGDTVAVGRRIGSVGASGRVTGPHLHWIVRFGNVTVDPMSWLEILGP